MKKLLFLVLLIPLLFACGTIEDTPPPQDSEKLQEVYDSIILSKEVVEDISLPTKNGEVSIEWSSNKEEVLSSSGKVNRGSEDETVILTAKLTLNKETKEKEFEIIVKAVENDSSKEIVQKVYDELKMPAEVIEDIDLIKVVNQVHIEWSSNNEEILSSNGKVTRGTKDETVILTAKLTLNQETKEKEFEIIVKALEDDASKEIVQKVYDSLEMPIEAKEDLELPKMIEEVSIEWSSNKEGALSSSGKVNRGEEDETVILTAKLTLNQETKEKKFLITVKALEDLLNINYTSNYDYKMDEEAAKKYPYYKGYLYPGLLNIDGSEHTDFKENKTTGKRINVKMFGAKANDESFDNTKAFQNAIASASAGDEVFVPKGKYYFSTAAVTYPYYAHIQLKEGVNLIGEGKEESILVSSFLNGEYVHATYGKKTTTLAVGNMSNSTISHLGFTANTDDSCLPADYNNTTVNNPKGNAFAPAFGISVFNTSSQSITQNIYIHDVYIEYFQYDGIRLFCTRDCKIADSVITKATDLGGGGAGYGIELRGYGHEYFNFIGTNQDSCYNIVTGVKIIGPYIRHGIILSYVTHNNLFYNNDVRDTADDAYDVHGQDEFLNMFVKNYGSGSRRGAGLGLGNTGSSHDESGYGNVLYENTFVKCKYGVTVARGTQYTQLIRNEIKSCTDGIVINNGPHTYQEDNKITK